MTEAASPDDAPFDLARFVRAQEETFAGALRELRGGRKRGHWMWFVFPQLDGLGFSSTTRYYAIKGAAEARAYLAHPVLGPRLVACAQALLALDNASAAAVFGYPDDLKLRSSMTLFEAVAGSGSVYAAVLERLCDGARDQKTLALLAAADPAPPAPVG